MHSSEVKCGHVQQFVSAAGKLMGFLAEWHHRQSFERKNHSFVPQLADSKK
jgi:hypothetical protein